MAQRTTDEKEEKQEKEEEKEEKERGEKMRNDPLSAMAWAGVLIWVGIVLLVGNVAPGAWAGQETWALIVIGAGIIFLVEVLIRILRPEYRKPIGGTLIFATILIAVGLGELFTWEFIAPLALVMIGAGILFATLIRRR